MQIERVPIDSLVFDPVNARKHGKRNLDAIKGSLAKFGQQKPIVVDVNNVVIAGNGTLEAARELGWKDIDIHRSPLKGAEAIAFALADNKTAELAEWDEDILGEHLAALYRDGWDIEDIGFSMDDLDFDSSTEGNTDPDEVPEVEQNKFGVERGQIWQLGEHRLMCGDSTSKDDVAKLMAGENAELCFTSPPYADQREYNGGKELSTEYLATFIRSSHSHCELIAVNLGISRKNNEVNPYWDDYIKEAKDCGLKLLSWNVWDRQYPCSMAQQTAMFPIEHEWVFVFGRAPKELKKTIPNKLAGETVDSSTNRMADGSLKKSAKRTCATHRALGTIQRIDIHRGESPHPAMFPVALPEAYIEACSKSGRAVYEPFSGSGSTLIACEKTGRKCYGMEIDPHYCSVIIERWQNFTGKEAQLLG